jgi:hypothetical protein
MARVEHVKSARKEQGNCGRCGAEILKGMPYKSVAFFRGPRKVRCGNCSFRPSELTQSKMSQALAAEETIQDIINQWNGEDFDSIKSDIADQAQEIRDVAEEYTSAADGMETNGSNSISDEWREKADALEDYASSIEDATEEVPDYEGPMEEGEDPQPKKDSDEFKAWVDEARGILAGPLGNMPD